VETDVADWSGQQRIITPAIFGGHNWHPMSFSQQTGLVYIPTIHNVYPLTPDPDYVYDPNTFNTGEDYQALMADMPAFQPRFCAPTRLTAWDPLVQAVSWEVPFSGGVPAGILSTAGGLVFQGTTDGELVAYDAAAGERLWGQTVNVGIMAPPVSYSVNGEQYIAVLAGIGGAQGGHSTMLENRNSGHVFAFKLGGDAEPPEIEARTRTVSVDESLLDAATIEKGQNLYVTHCVRCHGVRAQSSGLFPDLRHSTAEVHQIWPQIVLDGVFAARGMASFADSLDKDDVSAIHSYVISEALASESFGRRLMNRLGNAFCIPAEWLAD
jgi:quinohemoprotein ethanol dehydrogenase